MANESFKKLLTIQQKLNAPKGHKHRLGYSYRSAEDILAAVKPLLEATGTVLLMRDGNVNLVGNNLVLDTTVSLFDADTGDEIASSHASVAFNPTDKACTPEQQSGKASSYARKYALNGLFAIDDEVDADGMGDYRTPNKAVSAGSAAPEKSRKDILWEKYSKAPAYDPYKKLFLKLTGDEISPDDFTRFGWHTPFDKTDKRCIEEALKNYDDYCKQFKDKTAAAEEEIPF